MRAVSPSRFFVLLCAICITGLASCSREVVQQLPALGVIPGETTVSGISSGAYMAGQFQMAHATMVTGAAIIAGGPYGCAQSAFSGMVIGPFATMLNAAKAVSGCMKNEMAAWGVPDARLLSDKAKDRAEKGEIDPVADAVSDRVYIFSGTNDTIVQPAIVASAVEYYQRLGVPDANIRFVSDIPAGHGFVTEAAGEACAASREPFIVDCDYDQAKNLLTHLLGPLAEPAPAPAGTFIVFDQTPFTGGSLQSGMAEEGVVYVPDVCRAGGCRVHVAYHGCAQNRETVGDAFVKETGFQRYADTNRLVILFPQTVASLDNPQACWDWWGFTGADFLTRQAPQIRAVAAMLERLAQKPQ
ncbi:MAG: poly(3-hydroxybutyrate) depolymerase [Deltaproteobacteria bacterium]